MPLHNRVTPFGDIVAIPQKGMFTGNRGIIHDPATRTLLKRRWATKAWLTCLCEFRGRRRDVMARRSSALSALSDHQMKTSGRPMVLTGLPSIGGLLFLRRSSRAARCASCSRSSANLRSSFAMSGARRARSRREAAASRRNSVKFFGMFD